MSGFANEAYIAVTLNLLSLELKGNNPGKPTVAFESLLLLLSRRRRLGGGGQRRRRDVRPVSAGTYVCIKEYGR